MPNGPGRVGTIDLVPRVALSDGSIAKSAGSAGELIAPGSTRVSEDDLELHVRRRPLGAAGLFVLSDARRCGRSAAPSASAATSPGSEVRSRAPTVRPSIDSTSRRCRPSAEASCRAARATRRSSTATCRSPADSTSRARVRSCSSRTDAGPAAGPGPGGAPRPPLGPPLRPLPLSAAVGSLGGRGAHRRLPWGGRLLVWPAWSAGSTPTGEPPSGPPFEALILPPLRTRG